jgi:hypothetical protein
LHQNPRRDACDRLHAGASLSEALTFVKGSLQGGVAGRGRYDMLPELTEGTGSEDVVVAGALKSAHVMRLGGSPMAIPDDELAAVLRTLLRMTTGFYVGFAGMLEIGQLENLNYWVESKDHRGVKLWFKDDIVLEEAIGHFLRIRRERQLGYDIEIDLTPELGHIGPRRLPDS